MRVLSDEASADELRRYDELSADLRSAPATRVNRAREQGDGPAMDRYLRALRQQPFADVLHSMVRQAQARQAARLFAQLAVVLDLLADPVLREQLVG